MKNRDVGVARRSPRATILVAAHTAEGSPPLVDSHRSHRADMAAPRGWRPGSAFSCPLAGPSAASIAQRAARRLTLGAALLFLAGCGRPAAPTPATSPSGASTVDAKLDEVARIHGGAGPWAVAGYRMGEHALKKLGLERGSFDLEIAHYTPHEVQYSCIADGAAAATGASLGKLNLTLADATAAQTHTVYRRKSTGQSITLHVTAAFAARYTNVPFERLKAAGREVMQLRDDEIFEAAE